MALPKTLSGILPIAFLTLNATLTFQVNHPPVVKILSPAAHTTITPGAQLAYDIQVSDPEDGDTRYDEINPKEVLLELTHLAPGAPVPAPNSNLNTGLDIMASNNCFNCHLFHQKLLGPSFAEIAARYPATKANVDTLIRRVREGSSGIWPGTEKMPSHPGLSATAIRSTVLWILQNGVRQDRVFYNGATGLLRLPADKRGTWLLVASYTDHGPKDASGQRLKGSDRITITVK